MSNTAMPIGLNMIALSFGQAAIALWYTTSAMFFVSFSCSPRSRCIISMSVFSRQTSSQSSTMIAFVKSRMLVL